MNKKFFSALIPAALLGSVTLAYTQPPPPAAVILPPPPAVVVPPVAFDPPEVCGARCQALVGDPNFFDNDSLRERQLMPRFELLGRVDRPACLAGVEDGQRRRDRRPYLPTAAALRFEPGACTFPR